MRCRLQEEGDGRGSPILEMNGSPQRKEGGGSALHRGGSATPWTSHARHTLLSTLLPLFTLLCTLLPLLILPAGATGAAAKEETLSKEALLQQWSQIYGLEDRLPPRNISVPEGVPEAPHLQRCWRRAELQQQLETRGPQGEPPGWAAPEPDCPTCVPHTPWVQGSDYDNLPLTHAVQRDLWLYQFPSGNCSTRRLFVVMWPTTKICGIGSQLHLLSAALDLALEYNRTLVAYPRSYGRGDHDGCKEFGEAVDFACYFARFTTKACEAAAAQALRHEKRDTVRTNKLSLHADLEGEEKVVVTGASFGWSHFFKHSHAVAERWGQPWLQSGELQWAVVRPYGNKEQQGEMLKVHWWRSQALRFFLRWPSAYLCQLENKARHRAYGARMAEDIVGNLREEERIRARVEQEASAREGSNNNSDSNSDRNRIKPGPDLSIVRDRTKGVIKYGEREERYLFAEAAMPRPIVSIHVRQGDKGIEMKLFSFDAYMFLAHKLRAHVPYLKNVWLSTEMQSVVDAVDQYPSWSFLFTNNTRQELGTRVFEYEAQGGLEQIVGASFVNLLIASQCDYFVSMLNSNWNRLIHALRSTNGRGHALELTLNYGIW